MTALEVVLQTLQYLSSIGKESSMQYTDRNPSFLSLENIGLSNLG